MSPCRVFQTLAHPGRTLGPRARCVLPWKEKIKGGQATDCPVDLGLVHRVTMASSGGPPLPSHSPSILSAAPSHSLATHTVSILPFTPSPPRQSRLCEWLSCRHTWASSGGFQVAACLGCGDTEPRTRQLNHRLVFSARRLEVSDQGMCRQIPPVASLVDAHVASPVSPHCLLRVSLCPKLLF